MPRSAASWRGGNSPIRAWGLMPRASSLTGVTEYFLIVRNSSVTVEYRFKYWKVRTPGHFIWSRDLLSPYCSFCSFPPPFFPYSTRISPCSFSAQTYPGGPGRTRQLTWLLVWQTGHLGLYRGSARRHSFQHRTRRAKQATKLLKGLPRACPRISMPSMAVPPFCHRAALFYTVE